MSTRKMKAPSATMSMSQPPLIIGANIHADIYPIPNSIGGNNFILMSIDGRSHFVLVIPIPTKSTSDLIKAMDKIIQLYQSHGHVVRHFISDDENNVKVTYAQLRLQKISHSSTRWSA